MKIDKGSLLVWFCTIFMVMGTIGWVLNIIEIAKAESIFSGFILVRCIGVFIAPLGGILGWF